MLEHHLFNGLVQYRNSFMKISVAICTYNGEKYIRQQIESIIHQTYQVDEILVFDDRSFDNTVEIARNVLMDFKGDSAVLINEEQLGIINNFHKAFDSCTGDIIFSCDQDDIWIPEKVETMIKKFDDDRIVFAFSDAYVVDENLNIMNSLWNILGIKYDQVRNTEEYYKRLMKSCCVTGAAMAFRKSLWLDCKPIENPCIHDTWLSLMAPFYGDVAAIPEKLIMYRRHSETSTNVGRNISQKHETPETRAGMIKSWGKIENKNWFFSEFERLNAAYKRIPENSDNKYYLILKNARDAQYYISQCCCTNSAVQRIAILTKMFVSGKYKIHRGSWKRFLSDVIYSALYSKHV